MKVTLTDTTPAPVENTYSLTLEGLNGKDLIFLKSLSGKILGSSKNSPRGMMDKIYDALGDIDSINLKACDFNSNRFELDSIFAPEYDEIP